MYFTAVKMVIFGSKNLLKTFAKIQENASQIIKNPTASRALSWALDPHHLYAHLAHTW